MNGAGWVETGFFETLREVLAWAFVIGGSVMVVITGLALLRLPTYYARVHGAGLSDTLGAGLILTGLAIRAEWAPSAFEPLGVELFLPLVPVKLLMVLGFMLIISPAAAHALAQAAFLHGITPDLPPDWEATHPRKKKQEEST